MLNRPDGFFTFFGHTWGVSGTAIISCQLWLCVPPGGLYAPLSSDLRDSLLEDGDFYDEVSIALDLKRREEMIDDRLPPEEEE